MTWAEPALFARGPWRTNAKTRSGTKTKRAGRAGEEKGERPAENAHRSAVRPCLDWGLGSPSSNLERASTPARDGAPAPTAQRPGPGAPERLRGSKATNAPAPAVGHRPRPLPPSIHPSTHLFAPSSSDFPGLLPSCGCCLSVALLPFPLSLLFHYLLYCSFLLQRGVPSLRLSRVFLEVLPFALFLHPVVDACCRLHLVLAVDAHPAAA
ncbi:hypothetical protein S7711_01967 [Stachybotrys chartarum IBT 7711]|uniref:Uncharacterized protein n=1 Tax=Stachybotrys chartarum (strain CBS 109288 / IBT 7711) TaxID=1280523 RepID=A0A084AMZ9_STACB|nr:hypothetical protein S7711_01967 [Stachybotrys chartarum IBT 7711]KFA48792.1 hypothetical protein S40293_01514 [Stachybotrys chartarum IBT 40293]